MFTSSHNTGVDNLIKCFHLRKSTCASPLGDVLLEIVPGAGLLSMNIGAGNTGPGRKVILAIRNATQLVDFFEYTVVVHGVHVPPFVTTEFVSYLRRYATKNGEKIIAVALPQTLAHRWPSLCSYLWKDLDAVPLVLECKNHFRQQDEPGELATFLGWERKELDEQADSMARKCLRSFGVGHVLHNHICADGTVEVDKRFCVHVGDKGDYQETVHPEIWNIVQGFANDLIERKIKIAFFSMTCEGKPDVHTRHALVRFSQKLGVDTKWYVPKPRPSILQIVRKMEYIMEGLTGPEEHLGTDDELRLLEFAYENARRYWLAENGPLRPRSEGGADVVIIDSAPLLTLALLSKQCDPQRPVIFENRLHVQQQRLLEDSTSPQTRVWEFVKTRLKHVDILVSQLPRELTPSIMPDRFDGLNKNITAEDITFYGREFHSLCRVLGSPTISYPDEQYILHLSRLRLGDGTIPLLDAYATFCKRYMEVYQDAPPPKLLICHHGPPNSPENSLIYDRLLSHINTKMEDLAHRVCVVQVGPQDQMWNTLLTQARVLVQLSMVHGIPEVLLWALQKRKPVIASREARLFSFLDKIQNILLVDGGDIDTVSQHLFHLFTDKELYARVISDAPQRLPDNLTTVGNASAWMFLASKVSRLGAFEPNGEDIDRLARQEAGPYT
ncbi:hypothetical protein ABOM_008338 [Aspergillus bombycis]|uniref:Trehalose synthase N-terminal domain-containing protein n=1 Tax=Aspergillus bombycis TaxID=109264 RepID=A0A1F7ZSS5_9EURO|nr:hypothetical protein ABOM_008338 [Aspergillus bombycis]OGM42492.1 hypothetical protein ABOM_008338 [Aspergillus bombycis]